jgi:hypothetical protein
MTYNNLTSSDIEAMQQQEIADMTRSDLEGAYRTAIGALARVAEQRDAHEANTNDYLTRLGATRESIVAVVNRFREAMIADEEVVIGDWDDFRKMFADVEYVFGVDLCAPRRSVRWTMQVSATITGTCDVTDLDLTESDVESMLTDNVDWCHSVDFFDGREEFDDIVSLDVDTSYVDFNFDDMAVEFDD